jgi:hypothetical protein
VRARNIKPAIFKNELLGQADPLFMLVFIGLWCAADREGRLEDRPARLRAELVPYRASFDIEAALRWLQQAGFIDRYTVAGVPIIQVIKFAEHQRPHSNEVPSVLPAKVASPVRQGRKRAEPSNGHGEKDFALIPDPLLSDSPSLNPDIGLHETDSPFTALAPEVDVHASKYWDAIQKAWPSGNPRKDWGTAKKHAVKLVGDGGATWDSLLRNVRAYAEYCEFSQTKVMDPRNYFSAADKPWANTWVHEAIRDPKWDARRKEIEAEERAAKEAADARH